VRYFPELSLRDAGCLDALLSLRARAALGSDAAHRVEEDIDAEPYRAWIRLSSPQAELRAGLQKLDFGQATLLRPLMWFDRVDPRDSLGLTDGVYGLLARYYFLSNTRLWAWGLYGNGDPKGWEVFPSVETEPEYGGRLQTPLLGGEFGLSYHHRVAAVPQGIAPAAPSSSTEAVENRLGLDARWDVLVGLWLETTVSRLAVPYGEALYTSLAMVGLDYTLDWGNGLYVLCEHLLARTGEHAFDSREANDVSAALVQYPVGLVDNVRCIVNYDWENGDWFRFVGWEKVYDDWSFHLNVFWNPEQRLLPGQPGSESFAGTGAQALVVFNH